MWHVYVDWVKTNVKNNPGKRSLIKKRPRVFLHWAYEEDVNLKQFCMWIALPKSTADWTEAPIMLVWWGRKPVRDGFWFHGRKLKNAQYFNAELQADIKDS